MEKIRETNLMNSLLVNLQHIFSVFKRRWSLFLWNKQVDIDINLSQGLLWCNSQGLHRLQIPRGALPRVRIFIWCLSMFWRRSQKVVCKHRLWIFFESYSIWPKWQQLCTESKYYWYRNGCLWSQSSTPWRKLHLFLIITISLIPLC